MSLLRRIKFSYMLYNFFHKKELAHNLPLYKKWGIRKSYYSPVSSRDFKHLKEKECTPDLDRARSTRLFQRLNAANQQSILEFNNNGYTILRNYLSVDQVDAVNKEINDLLQSGTIDFRYKNKIMFAIHKSKLLRDIGNDSDLRELLSCLIGGEAALFQSINFIQGSEQPTHSDSIHMTTYPLGGLLGAWLALEPMTLDNGPLHYYPGSHKLPYYLNEDYDNEGNFFFTGDKEYPEYEEMMRKKIADNNLEKSVFIAEKGDLLIWHANLFHGGEPHSDKSKTRKSMVFHYFNQDAICYHEITQRPALIKSV